MLFGCLPDDPQWKREPLRDTGWEDREVRVHGNAVFQRMNDELVSAVLDRVPHSVERRVPSNFDIDALWKRPESVENASLTHANLLLDMCPVDPSLLLAKYEETLVNQSPLSLFPKQVLSKFSRELDADSYRRSLEPLMLSPSEVDAKYAEDSPFAAQFRDATQPLTTILRELKTRETQLQVILGLELMKESTAHEPNLDGHFDRLCIWQAVESSNIVDEFCTTVILPFFKTRAPKKVKQFIRTNRGTVKSRAKPAAKGLPSRAQPVQENMSQGLSEPLSGLAKALHIRNLASRAATPSEMSPPQPKRKRLDFPAMQNGSYSMYRQQSFVNQLEVKFSAKVRPRRLPVRVSTAPTTPTASIEAPPEETSLEATPPEEDIMSSTDNDD